MELIPLGPIDEEKEVVLNNLDKVPSIKKAFEEDLPGADPLISNLIPADDKPGKSSSWEFALLHDTFDASRVEKPVRDYVYELLGTIAKFNPDITLSEVKKQVKSGKSELRQFLNEDSLAAETFKRLFDLPQLTFDNQPKRF